MQRLAAERGKVTLVTGATTTALSDEGCSPTGFLRVLDTYADPVGPSRLLPRQELSTWSLLAADYAGGHQMQSDLARTAADGLRATPVDDVFVRGRRTRPDGRLVHDFALERVKSPEASKAPWDSHERVGTVPGGEAVEPLAETRCPCLAPEPPRLTGRKPLAAGRPPARLPGPKATSERGVIRESAGAAPPL